MSKIYNPARHGGGGVASPPNNLKSGLVSSYEMTDTNPSQMIDAHGTQDSTTTNDLTRTGTEYTFNGTSSYASIPDVDEHSFTDAEFSFSVMVKTTTTATNWAMYKGSNTTNREYAFTTLSTGEARFAIFQTGTTTNETVTSTTAVNDDAWHLITVIMTGARMKMYVDDVFEAETPITVTMGNLGSLLNVGRYGGGSLYWQGSMKKLRLWNRALTDGGVEIGDSVGGEVLELYNGGDVLAYSDFGYDGATLKAGLLSYWKLDEASGTLVDSQGTNDGTNNGATYGATGVLNDAMDFDGSNDYIDVGGNFEFEYNEDFSISAWVNMDADGGSYTIIGNRENSGDFRGWTFERNTSNQLLFVFRETAGVLCDANSTDTFTAASGWNHVVLTYIAQAPTFYLNGVETGRTLVSDTLTGTPTYAHNTTIGANNGGTGNNFDGQIDEVGIWNRGLSDREVLQLYNESNAQSFDDFEYWTTTLYEGITSYWKLDDSGSTAVDALGTNDGTITGATTGATGIINDALNFDGTSDYVNFGAIVLSTFTVSLWLNADTLPTTGNYAYLFSKGYDSAQEPYTIRLYNDAGTLYLQVSTYRVSPPDNIVCQINVNSWSTGTWYHVLGGYNGTDWFIQWNYTNVATLTDSGPYSSARSTYMAAFDNNGSFQRFFDGRIDETVLYERSLLDVEKEALYNEGNGQPLENFNT